MQITLSNRITSVEYGTGDGFDGTRKVAYQRQCIIFLSILALDYEVPDTGAPHK